MLLYAMCHYFADYYRAIDLGKKYKFAYQKSILGILCHFYKLNYEKTQHALDKSKVLLILLILSMMEVFSIFVILSMSVLCQWFAIQNMFIYNWIGQT